jgi:hypothetical protein
VPKARTILVEFDTRNHNLHHTRIDKDFPGAVYSIISSESHLDKIQIAI